MRSRRFTAALLMSAGLAVGEIGSSPCFAQTRITSLEQLRRELAKDDEITVVAADGQVIAGRLARIGSDDFDVRLRNRPTPRNRNTRSVTVPFGTIRTLERRRDSARNGMAIGAGVGAAAGAALFVTAAVVDRNEMDEWGPLYAGTSVAFAGVGALIGWAVDAARSKPHIRFETPAGARVRIQPQSWSGGFGVMVLFSP